MAHRDQRLWCEFTAKRHPKHFINKRVLDVGSFDVNGNNRYLFSGGSYLGIDFVPGKNVDRVCGIHDVPETFQTIISTEALEHDPAWQATLMAMVERLEKGGFLILTCAGPGRAEHGTVRCPMPGMTNTDTYYRNLSPADILGALPLAAFTTYEAHYQSHNFDTYFWGVKR
jgi:hypothetical protein